MSKKIIASVGIALAMGLNASAAPATTAAVLKIGFVDLQKALQETEAGKAAKQQLEKEVTTKRAKLEKTQGDLQKEAEQFEKNSGILNEKTRATKYAELQKKFGEFQRTAAESQMELQKRERELTKPLIDELRSMIEGIGKERDFNLVVEKNEGAVLYAKDGTDLTDVVIQRFNQKKKGAKKG